MFTDYSGLFYAFPYVTGLAYNGAAEFLPLAFFFLFEMDKLFRKHAHTSIMEWSVSENKMHKLKSVSLSFFSLVSIIFAVALVAHFLFYIVTKTDEDSDSKYQTNLIIRMIFSFSFAVQAGISSSCLESNYEPEINRLAHVVDTASCDVIETNENAPLLSHQEHSADAVIRSLHARDNGQQDEAMSSRKTAPANDAVTDREHHNVTMDHSESHELDGKILFYSMLPVASILSSHVLCSLFFLFFLKGELVYILFEFEAFVNVSQLWSQNYFLNTLLSTETIEINSFDRVAFIFSTISFTIGNFLFWIYDILQFKFIVDVKTPSSSFVPSLLWLVLVVVGFPAAILFR